MRLRGNSPQRLSWPRSLASQALPLDPAGLLMLLQVTNAYPAGFGATLWFRHIVPYWFIECATAMLLRLLTPAACPCT